MSNKKLILGVAAGVAALAVVGVIAKRRGYLDNLSNSEFGTSLKDKLSSVKETARKKFDEVTGHSENGSNSNSATASSNATGTGSSTGGKKGANMNTGNVGDINPATT